MGGLSGQGAGWAGIPGGGGGPTPGEKVGGKRGRKSGLRGEVGTGRPGEEGGEARARKGGLGEKRAPRGREGNFIFFFLGFN